MTLVFVPNAYVLVHARSLSIAYCVRMNFISKISLECCKSASSHPALSNSLPLQVLTKLGFSSTHDGVPLLAYKLLQTFETCCRNIANLGVVSLSLRFAYSTSTVWVSLNGERRHATGSFAQLPGGCLWRNWGLPRRCAGVLSLTSTNIAEHIMVLWLNSEGRYVGASAQASRATRCRYTGLNPKIQMSEIFGVVQGWSGLSFCKLFALYLAQNVIFCGWGCF